MSTPTRIIRIFISSPGDVVEERNQARRVIEGLQKRYPSVTLQPVLWEELALPATASFQETIDLILNQRPIDVAVFILWSRLGSPLSSRVSRADGTPYRSGTEREFDLMLTAFEQSGHQRPVILAYTRDDLNGFQEKIKQTPLNELEELLSQRKLAESFIREQFHDADGRNLRAYQTYREPVDFVGRLRTHLQQTLTDLLGTDAAPRWHEEPYRGLEVFDVRHADIFCGRDEETCDLLQRLRDQRRAGCAFAVIVGASGSGKSSLARAGVAATLLQHAGDDGVKQWRAAFVLPALMNQVSGAASAPRSSDESTGGLTPPRSPEIIAALARTLIAAVPELRTSPTSLDDIAIGLTQDPALTIRLSITAAFARAAESAKGEVRLLLVIDQMEELWTDRRITSEDRDHFFTVLEALSRSGHITVLATLRSDFYPHAQQAPAFLRLKGERGHFDLLPPSAAALQRLIVEPARLAGLTFERNEQTNRSLDEIIWQDATRDPTVLPLLQYALRELYEKREEQMTSPSRDRQGVSNDSFNRKPEACAKHEPPTGDLAHASGLRLNEHRRCLLTFAAYEQLGGVEGALGRRASATFHALPPEAQATLGTLLPHLVTIDVTGEQTAVRRRARLSDLRATRGQAPQNSELAEGSVIHSPNSAPPILNSAVPDPTPEQILVDALIAARFLTTDRQDDTPIVSLAHEALLRRWDELAQWITSNREHLRLRARVEHSQHRWASQGQHASLLLPSGLPLEEGQVLLREARPLLLAETTDYIERSLTHRQAESRRQRLIRTTALTMSLTAALIAILAALWISTLLDSESTARKGAVTAQLEESKAKSAAQVDAQKARDAEQAALIAQQNAEKEQAAALRENADHFWRLAVNIRDSKDPDPIRASHLFLQGAKSLGQIVKNQSTEADEAFRRSEGQAASAVDRHYVRTWKHAGSVIGLQFSREESRILTWSTDKTARLWDVTKPEAIQTFKHDSPVKGAQFSRDESRVLTWSDEHTVRLWDVTKPDPIQTFKHDYPVGGAQFSRDGSRVLTWSLDNTARLWDVTKPDPVQTFKHSSSIYGAQFSRDESRFLTWSDEGMARLWDVTKPDPIQTFKHEGRVVYGVRFSRDESRVLTWSSDYKSKNGEARLWDVTKPNPIQTFKHESSVVNGTQFSRDESRVLTWSNDHTARLWDVTKPDPIQTFTHDDRVYGAQFSRDELRVLTWSRDNTARLWDVTKPDSIQTFKHEGGVVFGTQFSRDEARVLTWSEDKTARLWDVTKADPIQTFKHEDSVHGAQFSRDESRVLTRSGNSARLWDVTKLDPIQTFKHEDELNGAKFSRDESRVLTRSYDFISKKGEARLWDVTKPEPIQTFKHEGFVDAQFSRDETRVLTWSEDRTARLWDVTKPDPIQTFKHESWVYGARFSRDESRVLTWCDDKTVWLWDVSKANPIQTFKHEGNVGGAHFSRDESRVLTWSWDKTARLWDVTKPDSIQTFKHEDSVYGALFSRDESRVLTWSGDYNSKKGEARLWDVTMPDPIQIFTHEDTVHGALFSRDESRLLTRSGNAARLWDVTKANPIQTFKHEDTVGGAHFSRDESRVLTWSGKTAQLWDVTKPDPIQTLKHDENVTGAQFSRNESRVLTWTYGFNSKKGEARLWDVTKPEPIQTFKHEDTVGGAQLSRDESRLLTQSGNAVRLWNAVDPLAMLTPGERILELEVRSATTLDANLKLRTLSFAEWQAKVQSPEYRAIEKKLPRPVVAGLPTEPPRPTAGLPER